MGARARLARGTPLRGQGDKVTWGQGDMGTRGQGDMGTGGDTARQGREDPGRQNTDSKIQGGVGPSGI